jgi:hypothetical protein
MSENKNFFHSTIFLYSSCALVFLLSLFLRSRFDIGPDTGIYLDLGKKVFLGKKYYYDFFESNFPLSFWLHVIPYFLASFFKISPVISAEIFVNLLGSSDLILCKQYLFVCSSAITAMCEYEFSAK